MSYGNRICIFDPILFEFKPTLCSFLQYALYYSLYTVIFSISKPTAKPEVSTGRQTRQK